MPDHSAVVELIRSAAEQADQCEAVIGTDAMRDGSVIGVVGTSRRRVSGAVTVPAEGQA